MNRGSCSVFDYFSLYKKVRKRASNFVFPDPRAF